MFTGLVEGQGRVQEIRPAGRAIRLWIEVPTELTDDCRVGDSIAINGCCLTIVEIDGRCWAFDAGEETLSKTNLGDLQPGHDVNLERSLPANGRLGGHFVQGHVDGVGRLDSRSEDGEWARLEFRVPRQLAAQMVPKGSVAVDGVSLTLVEVGPESFSVMLIPHTLEVTTLGTRKVGDAVNIETDILGKYVQRFLGGAHRDE